MAGTRTRPVVWTEQRKWLGNLIPLALWLPPTAYGLYQMFVRAEITNFGVQLLGAGVVLGWLATNWAGAAPNRRMGRLLTNILKAKGTPVDEKAWLVGFASPKYSSAIDPHEDVGFLVIEPTQIRFLSETRTLELAKTHARSVGYRPNVHTWVGLGRWVSVEGEIDDAPVRVLFEPRTRGTLVGNLRATVRIRRALEEWLGPANTSTEVKKADKPSGSKKR